MYWEWHVCATHGDGVRTGLKDGTKNGNEN